MVESLLVNEVKKYIIENMRDMDHKQVYHIKCDDEPIDTFNSEEEANEILDKYKKEHPGKQLIIEPGDYQSYEDMIDKLDKMGDEKDMKNKIKESKKSIIVTETQLRNIVKNLVNEDIPGIEVTKRAQAGSKKDANENLKNVESKLTKAASFDGNDKPKFPNQIGGEKKAIYPNSEEVTDIEDNDNRGTQDLDYDKEPGDEFRKREKMYLQGDKKTGNSQDAANVVNSDLGEKLANRAERKIKAHQERPMYNKEFQPVETGKDNLNEDIKRIKEMYSYNKKTQ
ncbi:MAG: hypothetical protein WC755_07790 [Candidatus Woesearchaeota archaeon]